MKPINSNTPAKKHNLEILAPAGSPESLIAAVRGGADAVYLGAGSFNARRNAKNFDDESLREAAALCHSRGVKIYLALNTLILQNEIPAALSLAEKACGLGLDALILQDLGLARLIRTAAPGIPLHASTQLSCHSPAGVLELKELGFSRIVLAREMARSEIKECTGLGAEIEIFVHGALCMSVSGQCYLSAMIGGRSGNRGLCAQPCRLPFAAGSGRKPAHDEKALSLKDLSLYDYMEELADLGVTSLKIEGRMKRPEYVAAAARCFSDARDFVYGFSEKKADPELVRDLQSVFSRSGFTSGYYTGKRGLSMFGARTRKDVEASEPATNRLAKLYEKELPRIRVEMLFEMKEGAPVTLTVRDFDGNSVKIKGDVPQRAIKSPLSQTRVEEQLSKTGGTPFLAFVACEIEEDLTIPVSSLNSLRRNALEELLRIRAEKAPIPFNKNPNPEKTAATPLPELKRVDRLLYAARFTSANQVPEKADLDLIFVPLNTPAGTLKALAENYRVAVEIPRGMFSSEDKINEQLKTAADCGISIALCGNIGAVRLARESGFSPVASFGMNITNKPALSSLVSLGVTAAVLSQELAFGQMKFAVGSDIPCGIIGYGRQPLMLLRNCPYSAAKGCQSCSGNGALTDRRGAVFPLACQNGCAELLNSVPLWLGDLLDELPPMDFILFYFTNETRAEVENIITSYRHGGKAPKDFTRGLYKRGVE